MNFVGIKDLAYFILAYGNVQGFAITPLKLQKILYYTQAWHIAKFNKHTLFDELPEAWVNGPVYKTIYHEFNNNFYRDTPLRLKDIDSRGDDILKERQEKLRINPEQLELVYTVVKHYSRMDGGKLVLLTHTDSPWNDAREGLGEFDRSDRNISIDSMYNFYNPKIAKS